MTLFYASAMKWKALFAHFDMLLLMIAKSVLVLQRQNLRNLRLACPILSNKTKLSGIIANCDSAATAHLSKSAKRGAVRANDMSFSKGLKVFRDGSAVEHSTYKVNGRENPARISDMFNKVHPLR